MTFQTYLNKNNIAMLRQKKIVSERSPLCLIRLVQLLLVTLSTLIAVAILGTAAHAFSVYQKGRALNNPWWLPLWPQHFYTANAKAVIGASAGIVLLNVVYIVLVLLPKVCTLQGRGNSVLTSTGQHVFQALAWAINNSRLGGTFTPPGTFQHHIQLDHE